MIQIIKLQLHMMMYILNNSRVKNYRSQVGIDEQLSCHFVFGMCDLLISLNSWYFFSIAVNYELHHLLWNSSFHDILSIQIAKQSWCYQEFCSRSVWHEREPGLLLVDLFSAECSLRYLRYVILRCAREYPIVLLNYCLYFFK